MKKNLFSLLFLCLFCFSCTLSARILPGTAKPNRAEWNNMGKNPQYIDFLFADDFIKNNDIAVICYYGPHSSLATSFTFQFSSLANEYAVEKAAFAFVEVTERSDEKKCFEEWENHVVYRYSTVIIYFKGVEINRISEKWVYPNGYKLEEKLSEVIRSSISNCKSLYIMQMIPPPIVYIKELAPENINDFLMQDNAFIAFYDPVKSPSESKTTLSFFEQAIKDVRSEAYGIVFGKVDLNQWPELEHFCFIKDHASVVNFWFGKSERGIIPEFTNVYGNKILTSKQMMSNFIKSSK